MSTPDRTAAAYWLILTALVLVVYLPGLDHELIFDDARLLDGTIFERYGSLMELRPRMLSYGSFVWVEAVVGEGWWKQRLVNIALHLGVTLALYVLFKSLLRHVSGSGSGMDEFGRVGPSGEAALRVGVALFALNPVAVYTVAYLVQRSILMATLFSVLACVVFVRGLDTGRRGWFVAAILLYGCAALSKGHSVMIAAMAVPLYVFVRRPNWRVLAWVGGGCGVVLLVGAALQLQHYVGIVGEVFDTASRIYLEQIDALRPGAAEDAWALSVLNQAALFFKYGLLWLFPNVQWMSVDMRPAFPLSWWSFPELPAALAYLSLLGASAYAVLRRSDALGFGGLCLLFPLLVFMTEFATVWIQDPFVLYRSYLWAIALPGLWVFLLSGLRPKWLYLGGLIVALLFAGLALERTLSLRDAYRAWNDAAEKVDLGASPAAVGRWRAFLNRGSYFLEHGLAEQAYADFARAEQLGEGEGSASFNLGVSLQLMKRHEEALAKLDAAAAWGFDESALHFHRGESLYALGRFEAAVEAYGVAIRKRRQGEEAREHARLRRAEAAVAAQRYDMAVADFEWLLQDDPEDMRLLTGLGMARIGQQNGAAAHAIFDALIARRDTADFRYGRALAALLQGDRAAARSDIEQALRADPDNPVFRALRERLGR